MPTDHASAPIIFLIPGQARPAADGALREVYVEPLPRDGNGNSNSNSRLQRMVAVPGEDAVEVKLKLQDSAGHHLRLVLHPHSARDLFASQQAEDATRPAPTAHSARTANTANTPSLAVDTASVEEVTVPLHARWQLPANLAHLAATGSPQRGLGDLVFTGIKLIALNPLGASVTGAANASATRAGTADTTAQLIAAARDGQVNEGVYRLQRHTSPGCLNQTTPTVLDATTEPQLVLIHGTFVDTQSTFGAWWDEHPGTVSQVFDFYQDRVYALDHATLGCSPIANALTLAQALPANTRLHLLTHSRGGLVAEVLAHACAGITDADIALFADHAEEGHNYGDYRAALEQLRTVLAGKAIRVERVVRVACPTHGTTLASGRLDAYFSVLAQLLENALGPLGEDVGQFLNDVARQRLDPLVLPGLESMVPGRALVRWLNRPGVELGGDMRVVAGDVLPNLLQAWIRTLLAYAVHPLFMGDNDLVVQTSAMYGGAPRTGGALFLLDRSADVDHVHYFINPTTANGVANALLQAAPPHFAPIGPLSASGLDSSGMRARPAVLADDGKRPAVLVLPGILGSNLRSPQQREWLVWHRVLGLINRIQWGTEGITQDDPVEDYYGELVDHLGQTHHVQAFGYDWRAPLQDSADHLAVALRALLAKREGGQPGGAQPVRILAHSMGGLVVRVMALRHPSVWRQMMDHADARFVMLGSPNGGSWAPMSIYTGDDRLGQMLAVLNGPFTEFKTRQKMVQFEGLLQLSAGLHDPHYNLAQRSVWEQMAAQDAAAAQGGPWHGEVEHTHAFFRWAIPSQAALTRAVELRAALDAQAYALGDDAARMALVLGESPATPCGLDTTTDAGVDYAYTAEGDGRVTWASACLPQVRTWKVPVSHGDLPKSKAHFAAYVQLLEGVASPDLVDYTPPGLRDSAARQPQSWLGRARDVARPAEVDRAALLDAALGGAGLTRAQTRPSADVAAPLQVQVQHGDLKFVREPLLLGHSTSLALSGSEAAVDHILDQALQDALKAGLYPSRVGDNRVFTNATENPADPYGLKRPPQVVVVGLGNEGDLKRNALRLTVRQGVLAYAQHVAQTAAEHGQPPPTLLRMAMTSIGSGGSLAVGEAVLAVVQGVLDANAVMVSSAQHNPWPQVGAVVIIEQYRNRAAEAWHTLDEAQKSHTLAITLPDPVVDGKGGMRQPQGMRYRGASHDLVRVRRVAPIAGEAGAHDSPLGVLEYSLLTSRARSELRTQLTQHALVDQLIAKAEGNPRANAELSCSLYRLLVPQELRAYLGNAGDLVLELDLDTAHYPWELVADNPPGAATTQAAWSFGARSNGAMVRRLRTAQFDADPIDGVSNRVLVIGVSRLKSFLGLALEPLNAVVAEVDGVDDVLTAAGFDVTALLNPPADDAINALLSASTPWKVVHLSGHGGRFSSGLTGMPVADDIVIGPAELKNMQPVPELVFVNCCHLGKIEAIRANNTVQGSHGAFAASVAEQLIRGGVRCVVAAGWAVDDAAAKAFAHAFYQVLGAGHTFGEAVAAARQAARTTSSACTTWAAYQCYGDLHWRLTPATDAAPITLDANPPPLATADELMLHLERLALQAKDALEAQRAAIHNALTRIAAQRQAPYSTWLASGRVAQALARAWSAVDAQQQAMRWYTLAINAEDASATLAAREQQLNLRARQSGATLADIAQVVVELQALITLAPTAERWSLLGSAHKLAVVRAGDETPGDSKFMLDQLVQMRDAYGQAIQRNPVARFYPSGQHLVARIRLHLMGRKRFAKPQANEIALLRQLAQAEEQQNGPDFWSTVARHDHDLIEALLLGRLEQRASAIGAGFSDVHRRVTTPRAWQSVLDNWTFVVGSRTGLPPGAQSGALQQLVAQLLGYAERSAERQAERQAPAPGVQRPVGSAPTAPQDPSLPASFPEISMAAGTTPVTPQSARAFVAATEFVAEPTRTLRDATQGVAQPVAFDALKDQALVVGSEVVSFVTGVSAMRRQDIVNSALFAQLVANKKVPGRQAMFDWYNAYFEALTQIGWVIQSSAFDSYHEESAGVEAHEAILKVAAVVLAGAPAALAVVTTTLTALKEMDKDNPWITLFNQESIALETARFQITLADQDPKDSQGPFAVTLMAFALDAKAKVTQVLFFRIRKNALALKHCCAQVTLNEGVLGSIRDALQAKLADRARAYVGEVEI